MNLLHASGYDFKDPEIMIYMLIELVSGSIYNPLLYEQPVPIDADPIISARFYPAYNPTAHSDRKRLLADCQ